jgi:hypothetical protein
MRRRPAHADYVTRRRAASAGRHFPETAHRLGDFVVNLADAFRREIELTAAGNRTGRLGEVGFFSGAALLAQLVGPCAA